MEIIITIIFLTIMGFIIGWSMYDDFITIILFGLLGMILGISIGGFVCIANVILAM
jgi:hypothetical protein